MKRIIRHGGYLQGGVICRRCNAKAVNLAGGEVRCGEIGAVISSAETSEAVKCSAPIPTYLCVSTTWSVSNIIKCTALGLSALSEEQILSFNLHIHIDPKFNVLVRG